MIPPKAMASLMFSMGVGRRPCLVTQPTKSGPKAPPPQPTEFIKPARPAGARLDGVVERSKNAGVAVTQLETGEILELGLIRPLARMRANEPLHFAVRSRSFDCGLLHAITLCHGRAAAQGSSWP